MRVLALNEIEFVAGGLIANPDDHDKPWYQVILDWINGDKPPPSSVTTISGAELGQLQRDCLDAGGNVKIVQSSGSANATFRVVDANGNEQYLSYECTTH